MQHIYLIGFMGSGKSYWGERVSRLLSLPFIDLDGQIEMLSGKSIAEIFSEQGESGFRRLERRALHAIPSVPPAIVATGGGTPCFFDNMDWMNTTGITIFFQVTPTILAKRLQEEMTLRPLLSGINKTDLERFIGKKLKERAPFYQKSAHTIEQADEVLFEQKLHALIAMAHPSPILPSSNDTSLPSSNK